MCQDMGRHPAETRVGAERVTPTGKQNEGETLAGAGVRAFLAFVLPPAMRQDIESLQTFFADRGLQGKWTSPESCHVTALFLGNQTPQALAVLSAKLREICAACAQFRAVYDAVNTFGQPPRVLALELADRPAGAFASLVAALREAVQSCGIAVDKSVLRREPRTHITLCRFRGRRESAGLRRLRVRRDDGWQWAEDPLATVQSPEGGSIEFDRLTLCSSVLQPAGPVYSILEQFELGPGPSAPGSA